ncbi:MAG TPA: 2-hydroxyacyl-CoA dehydratase family protein [Clostridia bacterium]
MKNSKLLEFSIENIEEIKKPKMGWFCNSVPEELIYAAGFHPYRIEGCCGTSGRADTYLPNFFCPYTVSCLEDALNKKSDFLEGTVFTNSCNAMERLYDIWKQKVGLKFTYMLDVPRQDKPESREYFKRCINGLKESIERTFGVELSSIHLENAIRTYNKTRTMLKEISDLITCGKIDISYSEFFNIIKASSYFEREEYNEQLLEILALENDELTKRKRRKPAVLLVGGMMADTGVINILEESGVKVICDDLCKGRRYYDRTSNIHEDPMETLCEIYLGESRCARMINIASKKIYMYKSMLEESDFDGIIYFSLKFCISHSYDYMMLKEAMDNEGIPVMLVEGDFTKSGFEQIKTRIQAFVEML